MCNSFVTGFDIAV
jgi:ribosome assembly protein 1